jgi:hypothetical protein
LLSEIGTCVNYETMWAYLNMNGYPKSLVAVVHRLANLTLTANHRHTL